jgi:hypothetical protein
LIVTAAAEAGCALLLSEDMPDGFLTRGLTVINPLWILCIPNLLCCLSHLIKNLAST